VGVSENKGTPKSSISIGCSIVNHPFWGTPILGNTQVVGFTSIFCVFCGGCDPLVPEKRPLEKEIPNLETTIFRDELLVLGSVASSEKNLVQRDGSHQ